MTGGPPGPAPFKVTYHRVACICGYKGQAAIRVGGREDGDPGGTRWYERVDPCPECRERASLTAIE